MKIKIIKTKEQQIYLVMNGHGHGHGGFIFVEIERTLKIFKLHRNLRGVPFFILSLLIDYNCQRYKGRNLLPTDSIMSPFLHLPSEFNRYPIVMRD